MKTVSCIAALLLLASCNRTMPKTAADLVATPNPETEKNEKQRRDERVQREIADQAARIKMEAGSWETRRTLSEIQLETDKKIRDVQLKEELDEIGARYHDAGVSPTPAH